MSINTELNLLKNTKENLRTAIMEKGVVVSSSDLFSTYPTRISQISTESGTYDESLKKLLDGSYTSYEIPNGTEKLKHSAFHSYTSLASITIPPTIKTVGSYAFYGCTSLSRVNITDLSAWCGIDFKTSGSDISSNPLRTADRLYMNGTQITNLVIPSDVTEIKPYVFYAASGFTSVVIPDSVTTIGLDAFSNCTGLKTVEIGTGITTIGARAFYYCSRLTSITLKAETPPTIGSVVFNDTNNCPIYVPEESVQAYKTAWPDYASRIQAIVVVVPKFVRISETTDATDGKYLIVDMDSNRALNASLITSTTSSSNGINNFNHLSGGNTISVTIEQDGTITANAENLNAAAYYDATNQKLYWEDGNNTKYYLSQKPTSPPNYTSTFEYSSTTTVPTTTITPYKGKANYITLKQTFHMGGNGSYAVSWYFYSSFNKSYETQIGRIALFKLDE